MQKRQGGLIANMISLIHGYLFHFLLVELERFVDCMDCTFVIHRSPSMSGSGRIGPAASSEHRRLGALDMMSGGWNST